MKLKENQELFPIPCWIRKLGWGDQTGQSRMTLTPMAIERSNRITYHVIGREKARIVSKLASASSPGGEDYPAAQIPGEWFLDREAASNLRLGEKL